MTHGTPSTYTNHACQWRSLLSAYGDWNVDTDSQRMMASMAPSPGLLWSDAVGVLQDYDAHRASERSE